MFSYSASFPFESLQRLYIIEASMFAGLQIFGSFNKDITESRIVLKLKVTNSIFNLDIKSVRAIFRHMNANKMAGFAKINCKLIFNNTIELQ